jgi:hypothetical protein
MPKTASEKCRLCAKLPVEEAIARHGPDGTNCWVGEPCHKRRTYYRNRDRYNRSKRRQYRAATGQEPAVFAIAPPAMAMAELHLYRARADAPLHAIGAELRRGDRAVARIDPVHAQGLSAAQAKRVSTGSVRGLFAAGRRELRKVRGAAGAIAWALSDLRG